MTYVRRSVMVGACIPFALNSRFQNLAEQMRILEGVDYGETFAKCLEVGIVEVARSHRLHNFEGISHAQ